MPETEKDKEKKKAEPAAKDGATGNGMTEGFVPTQPKKIKILDPRKVNSWGSIIQNGRTGEYDANVIKQIVMGAIKNGIDPYTAVSLGLQESGLGTYGDKGEDPTDAKNNWGQVRMDKWGGDKTPPELSQMINENPEIAPHALAMSFILKKKMGETKGNDEATKIQAYNGFLLKPKNDIGAKVMYGINLSKYPKGYNLKKDPKYGKAVIDLRENIIKKNPELISYIESVKQDMNKGMANGLAPQALNQIVEQ